MSFKSMTKAEIEKAITSVANRGKKLDADIQLAGLNILAHVDVHGDVSLVNKLYHALPKGSRRNALVEWFLMFGKVAVNADKATAKEFPLVFRKDGKTDTNAAMATPWYDCRPEPSVQEAFDFNKNLTSLINHIKRATDKGLAIKGNEELIKAVLAMEAQIDHA